MKKIAKILLLVVVCAMLSGCVFDRKINPKDNVTGAVSSAAEVSR